MKCNTCGEELPDEAKFCTNCGSKVVSQSGESKHFKIGNRTLVYNADMLAINKLHNVFAANSWQYRREYLDYYDANVKTFEDIYNKAIPLFVQIIGESLNFGFQILMEFGIDYIDREKFKDDIISLEDPLSALEPLDKAAEDIQEYAEALGDYRDVQRSSRSHWQGGGFGVKGAIKGAITAGALNLTTGGFRSIGDSITNANDRQRIRKLKDAVLNDPETKRSLVYSVYTESHQVFFHVLSILFEEGIVPYVDMDLDKALARINNYRAAYKAGQSGVEQLKDAVLDYFQICPFYVQSAAFYALLYEIGIKEQGNTDYICEMAQFFGVSEYYAELVFPLRQKRIQHAQQLPEATKVDIVKKIQSLQRLHDLDSEINFSDEISRLKQILAPTKYQN